MSEVGSGIVLYVTAFTLRKVNAGALFSLL